jgi:hypothetical protein
MGCDPIFVAGLDLGFPGGRTHYRGSFFETMALARGARLQPAELTAFRYVASGGPSTVPAAPSGSLVSDRRMEIYRRWFAEQLASSKAPRTMTLTTGGAEVPGIRVAGTQLLLRHPPVRTMIRAQLDGIRPLDSQIQRRHLAALHHHLSALAGELWQLVELGERALDTLNGIESERTEGGGVDFGPLHAVDREIERHSARAVASFLMQDAIARIRAGFGSAGLDEQFAASRALYSELRRSARYHAECIAASLPENHSS